jgi:hypothetical protein
MDWSLYSRVVNDVFGVAFYLAIAAVIVGGVLLALDRHARAGKAKPAMRQGSHIRVLPRGPYDWERQGQ